VEKTHEVTLHTEDMEDSICAVRSMSEFGLPLADDMMKDINLSLQIMAKAQPKRGYVYTNLCYFVFLFGKTAKVFSPKQVRLG
jgi:hypothetical protein